MAKKPAPKPAAPKPAVSHPTAKPGADLNDYEKAWCDCYARVLAATLPTGVQNARIVAEREANWMLAKAQEIRE